MSKRRKLGRTGGVTSPEVYSAEPPDATGSQVPFLTSIAQLVAIDDAVYGPRGLLGQMLGHKDREELFERATQARTDGRNTRQTLLDIGTHEFGMKPFDLAKAVPMLLVPSGNPKEAEATYLELRRRLENGHALVLGEPEHLTLVESFLRLAPDGPGAGDFQILLGIVPWAYALVASKTPALRGALGIKEDEKWRKGIAFELLLDRKEPAVRTVTLPDDPTLAGDLFRWLFWEVIHRHLFVPPDIPTDHGEGEHPGDSWLDMRPTGNAPASEGRTPEELD